MTEPSITEWGVRFSAGGDTQVANWGDDKLGAQRSAEMYRAELVQHQVGPWVPVDADEPEEGNHG